MASLSLSGSIFLAAKPSKQAQKKGLLEWLTDGFQKPGQMFETDPILKKVNKNNDNPNNNGLRKKGSSPPTPQKKKSGGFGGLFFNK